MMSVEIFFSLEYPSCPKSLPRLNQLSKPHSGNTPEVTAWVVIQREAKKAYADCELGFTSIL